MGGRRRLATRLEAVRPFADPRIDLEQYPTPAEVAAHLVHLADLRGDVADRPVIDLGSGTGMLAIAMACRDPAGGVVGLERDRDAITLARENASSVAPATSIEWMHADVGAAPLREGLDATVVMNPPFGAQQGHRHADRLFLETARRIGLVSYSFHNAGSRSFIEAFVADNAGTITDAAAVEFDLRRQFTFHEAERTTITAELYRIEWARSGAGD